MSFRGWLAVIALGLPVLLASFGGCGQPFTAGPPAQPGEGGQGGGQGGQGSGDCASPADCPGLDTDCSKRACTAGACGFDLASAGTACEAGKVCDGSGACVECVRERMCVAGEICLQNECAPATCDNGSLDGDESDIDCGGSCPQCPSGKSCNGPDDCKSGFCDGGTCEPCTSSDDCGDGQYCDVGLGKCTPKKSNGDVCAKAAECASGFCPANDGVCCDTACDATCTACLQGKNGGTNGLCGLVPATQDPDVECVASPEASCGPSGGCSGDAPACILWNLGTPCAASMCDPNSPGVLVEGLCDGAGACMGSPTSCFPYVCAGGQCKGACATDSDCLTACNAGSCLGCGADLPVLNAQCTPICSGGCAGGVCNIVCSEMAPCNFPITCPPGMPCKVTCASDSICDGAPIVCPPEFACEVDCTAGVQTCRDATIQCGVGTCSLACGSGMDVCQNTELSCGPNACTATCNGSNVNPTVHCNGSCACSGC